MCSLAVRRGPELNDELPAARRAGTNYTKTCHRIIRRFEWIDAAAAARSNIVSGNEGKPDVRPIRRGYVVKRIKPLAEFAGRIHSVVLKYSSSIAQNVPTCGVRPAIPIREHEIDFIVFSAQTAQIRSGPRSYPSDAS